MSADFDVIILGAGISGLVAASVLSGQGAKRIAIADEYAHIGGNHIDIRSGDYTFDVGSFIFQDDSPLLRHFPELLPLYVPIRPSFGRLNPQGRVTRYPISVADDLLAAGPVEMTRILASVAQARLFPRAQCDARSFARYWIGDRLLQRSGLEHYMERFYGVDASKIDVDFARARMGWIEEHAKLSTHIRRMFRPAPGPVNTQLARPREGFSHLYSAAQARLAQRGVQFLLGASFDRLERDGGAFALYAGGEQLAADRLVSTIPIPRLEALCGLPVSPLHTVTLISLFYSFSGVRGFDQSVLFNFSRGGAWKRLTMHSDFYGRAHGRDYFNVEVTGACANASEADADFRAHTAANGLLGGDLRFEGSHRLTTAYPIYTHSAAARAEQALRSLRAIGVESFGRQGGFDYQPTARASTVAAEAALHRAP